MRPLVDVAPLAMGRASGITMTGYYLGALIAPVLFGALADGPGYSAAWSVCAASALSRLRGLLRDDGDHRTDGGAHARRSSAR